MKIIRIMDSITVVLNNGEIISSSTCTDEMFNDIYNNQEDEDYIKKLLLPEFDIAVKKAVFKKTFIDNLETSNI